MKADILKEKLLSLGYCEDNQYLDFYCKLIEDNECTKKESGVTERHHIIPRSLFGLLGIENTSRGSAREVNKDNIVNLTYKNHLMAHYYLALIATNEFKKVACYAFTRMVSKIDVNKRPTLDSFENFDMTLYEDLKYSANVYMIEHARILNKHIFKEDLKRISFDELYDYYIIQNHSVLECSEHFDTTKMNISKMLRIFNIRKKFTLEQNMEKYPRDLIFNYYITEDHNYYETIRHFKIDTELFSKLCAVYGIDKKSIKLPSEYISEKTIEARLISNLNNLKKDIYETNLDQDSICEKYNITPTKYNKIRLRKVIRSLNLNTPRNKTITVRAKDSSKNTKDSNSKIKQ